jgi:N6-adenosine-specific RNA methylase IME4
VIPYGHVIPRASVLVADPAWQFGDRLPGLARGADKHYATMSIEDICALELPPLADDCVLFLWRVASMQDEALRVIRAWGFNGPKSELIWLKRTVKGNRWFGMGRYVRAEHETCLIATRGRPTRKAANVRSTFEAINWGHSEKPDEFYNIVEALYDGPYTELFARNPVRRPHWTYLGDEA